MKKLLLPLLAAGIILAFAACGQQAAKTSATQTAAASESKQAVEAFGVIKGTEIRDVTIDFPAVIEKVQVRNGSAVKSGEPVMTLDTKDYEAQIANKELELNTAKQALEQLKSLGNTPDMKKLGNDLASAQDLYNQSVQELDSKKKLLESGAISQAEYDAFRKTVDANRKTVEDIRFTMDSSKYNNQLAIDQKNVQIAQLESELAAMKDKLAKDYIRQDGIVSNVQNGLVYDLGYVVGDIANPAVKAFSIMNLDSMIVEANVAEEFIKDVKVGAEVTITPLADKSRQYKGKVTRISGMAVQKSGETDVPVEISIENNDNFLRPDFNVDVSIAIQ